MVSFDHAALFEESGVGAGTGLGHPELAGQVVQGEAVGEKQKVEKQVKVGSEVEKDKIVKKQMEKK